MTVVGPRSLERIGPRIRLGLLLIVSVFVAHDAVYIAQYGLGGRLAAVMSERGHDGYWPAMIALAVIAAAVVVVASATTITRLRLRLGSVPVVVDDAGTRPDYRSVLLALWRVLFPATVLVFAIQENLEVFAAHGVVPGIDVLFGPEAPLAIPVLAAVTLALAAIGAVVRWRIAYLQQRVARVAARRPPILSDSPSREWRTVHARAPHRWTAVRLDAGRAPPLVLPA
jgi:hypothetical protein